MILILKSIGKTKLLLLFTALFYLLLCLGQGTCSASGTPEPMYQITETELVTLENNLASLKAINEKLQMESRVQREQLHVLREESSRLLCQLNELKQQSQTQESSLISANKLLEEYATEAKRARLRIKAQRNAWEAIAACLVVALAVK